MLFEKTTKNEIEAYSSAYVINVNSHAKKIAKEFGIKIENTVEKKSLQQ